MSLLPFVHSGAFSDPFEDLHREMRRFERAMPYWRSANIANLNAATDVGQVWRKDQNCLKNSIFEIFLLEKYLGEI